ncbi:hypothetical protein EM595_p1039 (plasmid) [Duffyella gerundensis]|uniref:Uncharacterized protein n=1 Tax=Duffyella gerundensis TaxID=1619313 RepID=A0A0U5L780_9GAMM|nr:hypothetical protein EM595_p1039 [Duffyella gerundensis]
MTPLFTGSVRRHVNGRQVSGNQMLQPSAPQA